jgi:hypothetical protein
MLNEEAKRMQFNVAAMDEHTFLPQDLIGKLEPMLKGKRDIVAVAM